jgi:glycosyltransferase involved in cell wall biosynthesis
MKIGILGPATPFRGGIAQFLHNMADELAIEHEVVVISFISQYPGFIFPGRSQMEPLSRDCAYPVYRSLTPYNPLTWKSTAQKIISEGIEQLIIKFWIPFFCPAYTYIIKYLKKHSQVKIHILCHNLDFHEKWLMGRYLTKKTIQHAHSIIALSENVYRSSLQLAPQKTIKLFHPLYEVEKNQPLHDTHLIDHIAMGDKCVLFFGFIKDYKGLDIFLRAIPDTLKRLPDLQFIIAGEVYGRTKKYHQIIDSYPLDIRRHILFLDKYIPSDEVGVYFSRADVVVVPYRTATQSGIISLAYSYQLPVIVSRIDGLSEMVVDGETGLLFASENHIDLSEKIVKFFQAPTEYKKNVELYNSHYTWKSFVREMIEDISGNKENYLDKKKDIR